MMGTSSQEWLEVAGHVSPLVKKEKKMSAYTQVIFITFIFIQCRAQAQGMMLPSFMVGYLTSTNLIKIISLRCPGGLSVR